LLQEVSIQQAVQQLQLQISQSALAQPQHQHSMSSASSCSSSGSCTHQEAAGHMHTALHDPASNQQLLLGGEQCQNSSAASEPASPTAAAVSPVCGSVVGQAATLTASLHYSGCRAAEQPRSTEQLGPQISAAALGKLRAAAGCRNAAKLQQYRPASSSGVASQPALCALLSAAPAAGADAETASQSLTQTTTWAAERPCAAASIASSSAGSSSAGQRQQQQQQQLGSSAGDKLSTILAYLDAVEQEPPMVNANMQIR
jgi:hypothetical protein